MKYASNAMSWETLWAGGILAPKRPIAAKRYGWGWTAAHAPTPAPRWPTGGAAATPALTRAADWGRRQPAGSAQQRRQQAQPASA